MILTIDKSVTLKVTTYFAQPYFDLNRIRIYTLGSPSTTNIELDLSGVANTEFGRGGLNAVLIHKGYIFASFDTTDFSATPTIPTGGVIRLDLLKSLKNPTNLASADPVKIKITATDLNLPCAGMAIDPATEDLYVATFVNASGNGGIYKAVKPYTDAAAVVTFADPTVAEVCANVAFDPKGNLWFTTWTPADYDPTITPPFRNDPTKHFLVCLKGKDRSKYYKFDNTLVKSYPTTALPGGGVNLPSVHLLSAPEGIAFDSAGNLWIGNNNDKDFTFVNGPGEGTLVKVKKASLDVMLNQPSSAPPADVRTKIANTSVEIFSYIGSKFGGITAIGDRLLANDQGKNQGDKPDINGEVWSWNGSQLTPASLTSFVPTGVRTTYPGNGQGSLARFAPVATGPWLVIRDDGDDGLEPNTVVNIAYNSPDIIVRRNAAITPDPNNPPANEDPIPGQPAYVYVKVTNQGSATSSGAEQVKLYWASASTGLGWPAPWDGINKTAGNEPYGGQVGSSTVVPVLAPGDSTLLRFEWSQTPNPIKYGDNEHFCLLARLQKVSTPPFGMSFPEETGTENALLKNVVNNATIAWRNIHIAKVNSLVGGGFSGLGRAVVTASNYGQSTKVFRLRFRLIDGVGQPMQTRDGSPLSIRATGESLERLRQSDPFPEGLEPLSDGRFQIVDNQVGITNLKLQPNERLSFEVELEPQEPTLENFAIVVEQFVEVNGFESLVGGQAFIVGEVTGFDVKPVSNDDSTPTANRLWLWLLALIILLILLLAFLLH